MVFASRRFKSLANEVAPIFYFCYCPTRFLFYKKSRYEQPSTISPEFKKFKNYTERAKNFKQLNQLMCILLIDYVIVVMFLVQFCLLSEKLFKKISELE